MSRLPDPAPGPCILCPVCRDPFPLRDGYGLVGSKVWYCVTDGYFGPGTRQEVNERDHKQTSISEASSSAQPSV